MGSDTVAGNPVIAIPPAGTGTLPRVMPSRVPSAPEHTLLGLPEMDSQHDYLYTLFARLIETHTPASMKALLAEIEGMLDFHFTSEEHLIRHYKVPGFAEHQADHEQAATAFLAGLAAFERGELNPARLRATLTGWLSEHARSADQPYADRIRRQRREAGWQ